MRLRSLAGAALLVSTAILALPTPADAQLRRLRDAAKRAVESEAESIVDRLIREAIRCAIDDPTCAEEAQASGEDVIYTDANGEIITDEEGTPITDRDAAMAASGTQPGPGEGIWANYDFVPGDDILYFDDFTGDRVGDFPRRIELIEGTWDIVEIGDTRYFRAMSQGLVRIPLPETLPDRFTIEFEAAVHHGNGYLRVTTGPAFFGPERTYEGSVPTVRYSQAGLARQGSLGPEALARHENRFENTGPVPFRITADGDYMKIYLGEQRVANVPNSVFPRTDAIYLAASSAVEDYPILIGPIRIASGGRDLYDRLTADGRVATQGILFATDSDRIRPESTPTLDEIGEMLTDHPELRIAIEGHTDSDGEDAYNQDLSERRAAAVKAFIADRYGIDEGRLESAGYGESQPVADNLTPEGKQQNRRVELVQLGG